MPKPDKVLVYLRDDQCDGETFASTSLSIKSVDHIGESNSGLKYLKGQLSEIQWNELLKWTPTRVEIAYSKTEFEALIEVLEENYEDEEICRYFGHVRELSLHNAQVNCESLLKLLKWFPLLGIFAFSNITFSKCEWQRLICALSELQIRGIEISDNILPEVARSLNISFMKFIEDPGIDIVEFKNNLEFITVKGLFAQGLLQTSDDVAEQFLLSLDSSFPRLQILILDWNIVDAEVLFDDRTIGIIDILSKLYEKLEAIAIVAYTPDSSTKSAMNNISSTFGNKIEQSRISLVQFGTTEGIKNLSLLTICESPKIKSTLMEIFVQSQTANPSMISLLNLIDENLGPSIAKQRIEFAGFENELIRRTFEKTE